VIGATGTGKSTAVRLAVRSLPAPKGVVYFSTPEIVEDISTELAVQVGYRGEAVDLAAAFYEYLRHSTRSADLPSVDHEPLASWRHLRKRLVSAANKFFAEHNRPMVLVIDAFDRVCRENPRFVIQLQDFAKDGADNGSFASSLSSAGMRRCHCSHLGLRGNARYDHSRSLVPPTPTQSTFSLIITSSGAAPNMPFTQSSAGSSLFC
jgi:KaiC/GvpD/RAD55 family RecA-like ATPase